MEVLTTPPSFQRKTAQNQMINTNLPCVKQPQSPFVI